MIAGVQVLGILFSVAMMYFTFLYYKKKHFRAADTSVWVSIWLAFLFAVCFPETLVFLLQPLVVQRVMDLVSIGAFSFLFVVIFYLYTKTRENDESIKKIVRKLALK